MVALLDASLVDLATGWSSSSPWSSSPVDAVACRDTIRGQRWSSSGDCLWHRGCVDFSSATLDATRGRLLARFGARVQPWWEQLPAAIADLAERWELVVGEAVGRGNTSLVVRCQRADGRPAVLKLTPDAELGREEASALRRWEPSGRVPLVWGDDAALGALLLEAIPGETPLSERPTAVQLDEVANLISELHRSGAPTTGEGWATLAERIEFIFEHWIERHGRRGEVATNAVPVDRLRRGHELARALAANTGKPVLLHGDLHPSNVLDGGAVRGLRRDVGRLQGRSRCQCRGGRLAPGDLALRGAMLPRRSSRCMLDRRVHVSHRRPARVSRCLRAVP